MTSGSLLGGRLHSFFASVPTPGLWVSVFLSGKKGVESSPRPRSTALGQTGSGASVLCQAVGRGDGESRLERKGGVLTLSLCLWPCLVVERRFTFGHFPWAIKAFPSWLLASFKPFLPEPQRLSHRREGALILLFFFFFFLKSVHQASHCLWN